MDLGGGAAGGPAAPSRPEVIKAIPVRHWGRWLSAAIVVYLVVALVFSFIKSPNVDWPTVFDYMFKPLTLRALALTIELTFVTMAVGAAGGTILAIMRISDNPVLNVLKGRVAKQVTAEQVTGLDAVCFQEAGQFITGETCIRTDGDHKREP